MILRRALPLLLGLGLTAGACGDDDQPPSGDPDSAVPVPDGGADAGVDGRAPDGDGGTLCFDTGDMPASGPLVRPDDLPAPTGCVAGGMAIPLDGRWLIHSWSEVDGDSPFNYWYPLIEATCEAGVQFRHRAEGGLARDTYWDADTLLIREDHDGYVTATRICATADGFAATAGICFGPECYFSPAAFERFAALDEPPAVGLELVAESPGGLVHGAEVASLDLRVQDGTVYLSRWGDVRVLDVSDPAAPVERTGIANDEFNNDVEILPSAAGPYLAISGDGRTYLASAVDPTDVQLVSQIGQDEYSHTVFVDQVGDRTYLYLGNQANEIPVYDVTNPVQPFLAARIPLPSDVGVHDLFADDGMLYAAGSSGGLVVVDARDLQAPVVLGQIPQYFSHDVVVGEVGGRRVAFHGGEGYGTHLQIYDVDPASPTFLDEIGSWQTRRQVSIHNMMLVGTKLYIAYYQDGLRILDVADPTAPQEIAHYQTLDPARPSLPGVFDSFDGAIGIDVDPATGLIYLADVSRGLLILRETD
jgi:hypothetical protein